MFEDHNSSYGKLLQKEKDIDQIRFKIEGNITPSEFEHFVCYAVDNYICIKGIPIKSIRRNPYNAEIFDGPSEEELLIKLKSSRNRIARAENIDPDEDDIKIRILCGKLVALDLRYKHKPFQIGIRLKEYVDEVYCDYCNIAGFDTDNIYDTVDDALYRAYYDVCSRRYEDYQRGQLKPFDSYVSLEKSCDKENDQ